MNSKDIKKGFPPNIPFPRELEQLIDWTNQNGYPISGYFELRAGDKDTMFYWFGFRDVDEKLAQFGAGADGSLYCIWDAGDQSFPVVHLGSEGDGIKVLAANFKDFLRLLAIGYGELGFEDLSKPPEGSEPNLIFQNWVKSQFNTNIPTNGSEFITLEENGKCQFANWVDHVCKKYN
ncbi:hypothetical protein [Gimesia maris]|uniref:hypothetical protein n=1 Tax=Gimesia maris TaxID=122 RepID=UPI0030DBA19E|tara:strand:+ start:45769 stop:46299 length:531 start_codon:yes stop_codon:yes gene_type:complete